MSNLRYAIRTLLKTRIVSLVAILSLALGIGANTAIFSVLDQLLLQKLPIRSPDQLVNISANGPHSGSNSTNIAGPTPNVFSYPMFRDLEKRQTVFTGIAGHVSTEINLSYKKQTSSGQGAMVSGSYFPVLEAVPAAGRLFSPDDDKAPGASPVAVLGYRYWASQFDKSASIINDQILVNGVSFTVIGVAPEGFAGTSLGVVPEVYVPINMREAIEQGWKGLSERRSYWVYMFARLKPGVSLEQAQASINQLFRGIIQDVDLPLQKGSSDRFRQRFREQIMMLAPGAHGQSEVLLHAATPMTILLSITGFVLLIACANVANLLLAKSAGRSREICIRLAVGAQRAQLIRQLLMESVLLAVAGGLAGLAISYATMRALISFFPADLPLPLSSAPNPRSLLFTLATALLTGLLFGLFPAFYATKHDLATVLKDDAGSVSSTGAAARFRKVLVTGQIALSLLLLILAGLFLKSLVNIINVDLGLRTKGVLTFGLSPDRNQYKPDQIRDLYARLEESIGTIPGVESITMSQIALLADNNRSTNVTVDGFTAGPDTNMDSSFNEVGAGFFRTLAVPLVRGREFALSDTLDAPKVAIVNEAFKRKFSPNEDIVGKRMQMGNGKKNDIDIVGMARDAKYAQVKDPAPPLFYRPYRQDKELGGANYYVLVRGVPPAELGPSIRRAIAALDPNLPVERMHTFERQVEENVAIDRMITTLAGAFALLATFLAAVGLYGVLAYSVARRTREIAIRLAIGADPGTVRLMILKEVGVLALIGTLIGVPGAVALAKVAEPLLYGLKSSDPSVVVAATALIFVVALGAGYFPARLAMRVTPVTALRYE
jgi:predicted permease